MSLQGHRSLCWSHDWATVHVTWSIMAAILNNQQPPWQQFSPPKFNQIFHTKLIFPINTPLGVTNVNIQSLMFSKIPQPPTGSEVSEISLGIFTMNQHWHHNKTAILETYATPKHTIFIDVLANLWHVGSPEACDSWSTIDSINR